MIKRIIIFIGAIFLLMEQIQTVRKERTTSTIFYLVMAIVMLISSIVLLVGEFV
jgi:predicted membrane channel-forming protein YqfA (hemolysin III family)